MRRHLCSSLVLLLSASCAHDDAGTETHSVHTDATSGAASTTSAAATDSGTATAASTGAAAPPAAPTGLMASLVDGGVHLIWTDASDDEDSFILERRADGDADFSAVVELPFDSVTFHDDGVAAATHYTYRVIARNAAGDGVSDEVMIMVP